MTARIANGQIATAQIPIARHVRHVSHEHMRQLSCDCTTCAAAKS